MIPFGLPLYFFQSCNDCQYRWFLMVFYALLIVENRFYFRFYVYDTKCYKMSYLLSLVNKRSVICGVVLTFSVLVESARIEHFSCDPSRGKSCK